VRRRPDVRDGRLQDRDAANGTTSTTAASGKFTPADVGRLNAVAASAGTTGVRFVRFSMIDPEVLQTSGASCPGPFSGCFSMDMTELEVDGSGG
jgi:hypothetical protein